MLLLLALIAQAAAPDQSSNLLAIAALIAAVVPLGVAAITYARRDRSDTPLDEDAVERVKRLKADIAELTRNVEDCRRERRVEHAEGRVKDMHIGSLEAQLAEAKKQLRKEETRGV